LFTYSLEIIMDTQAIIDGIMQRLVDTVSDEVIRKLKAEGSAEATLAPETLAASLLHLLEFDASIRESIRDMVTDTVDKINLSDHSEFNDLERQVSRLEEKLDELEATPVDADNSDFQDAVCSVIRNHI
jgi:O6-methylguanine-DNA--protein-cysteine methyltransferase